MSERSSGFSGEMCKRWSSGMCEMPVPYSTGMKYLTQGILKASNPLSGIRRVKEILEGCVHGLGCVGASTSFVLCEGQKSSEAVQRGAINRASLGVKLQGTA